MHQSAMKELTILIIFISCLDIVVKIKSTKQSKCMILSPQAVLIHVSNELSRRHNRKTLITKRSKCMDLSPLAVLIQVSNVQSRRHDRKTLPRTG
jgi:hypothetical protein